jgi:hypothetical protein
MPYPVLFTVIHIVISKKHRAITTNKHHESPEEKEDKVI